MSYTPTNWQTGDTITAEKLNNIETGIETLDTSDGENIIFAKITPTSLTEGTCNYTPEELLDYIGAGKKVMFTLFSWPSCLAYRGSSVDMAEVKAEGLAINPMDGSLSLYSIDYIHSLITGNTTLRITLTKYADRPT